MKYTKASLLSLVLIILAKKSNCDNTLSASTHDIQLKIHENVTVQIVAGNNFVPVDDTLNIIIQHTDIISTDLSNYPLNSLTSNGTIPLTIKATGAGKSDIYANTTNNLANVDDVFIRVTVHKVEWMDHFSAAIGWIYFVAWSVSFYPQVWINWRRKSVIGLNFDFLSLNVIGFMLYSVFNLGLFFIPEIKTEYFERYPRGLNPVQVNDIFFAVHAVAITVVTIIQCFVYESGNQRVSTTARCLIGLFAILLTISMFLSGFSVIHWLDFLYICSYVKLTITLIKYIPQAYMNYKRKSTIGWSIGNIFLDFTGGSLSMLQMILNAYNYDDWKSIFGDPTKFGLGMFSVIFDVFFILQHFVFYRHSNYEEN